MPRVKTGSKRRQKRKKILKLAKGYRGGRKNLRRTAMDAITPMLIEELGKDNSAGCGLRGSTRLLGFMV